MFKRECESDTDLEMKSGQVLHEDRNWPNRQHTIWPEIQQNMRSQWSRETVIEVDQVNAVFERHLSCRISTWKVCECDACLESVMAIQWWSDCQSIKCWQTKRRLRRHRQMQTDEYAIHTVQWPPERCTVQEQEPRSNWPPKYSKTVRSVRDYTTSRTKQVRKVNNYWIDWVWWKRYLMIYDNEA